MRYSEAIIQLLHKKGWRKNDHVPGTYYKQWRRGDYGYQKVLHFTELSLAVVGPEYVLDFYEEEAVQALERGRMMKNGAIQ